jgi:superfamily II DNA or RNA helicase
MVVRVLDRYTLWGRTWCKVLQGDGTTIVVAEDDLQQKDTGLTGQHLRYLALAARIQETLDSGDVAAAYGANLLPLPHQVLVLERVLGSRRTRFLLADEVGLGKTIEAGLVIKELKLRGKVRRVLVIAPHALAAQWQSEMHQRFNEDFSIIVPSDLAAVARLMASKDGQGPTDNPWRLFDNVIVPLDSVKPRLGRSSAADQDIDDYNRLRFDQLVSAGWDLVVVDECHKLAGYAGRMARNVLGDAIAQAAPRILLLSATPHQGKTGQFKRLLHILDPQAFTGQGEVSSDLLGQYVLRTEKRKALDYDGKSLFHERHTHLCRVDVASGMHPAQVLFGRRMEEFARAIYARAIAAQNAMLGFLVLLLLRMASSSTEAGLQGLWNRLAVLTGQPIETEPLEADDMSIDDQTLEAASLDPDSEIDWIRQLVVLAQNAKAEGTDAKADELIHQIDALRTSEANPDLKVLIFTEFRATQGMLQRLLADRGYAVVLVNGGMSPDERMAAQKQFSGQTQVLISTDAGGEGVNLQFCHVVFNYDLPWNPMKLEQRIGRVDRIGQSRDVEAVNLVVGGSAEERVQGVLMTKLRTILTELGIDKVGDVLDSSIEMEDVEGLYLQSLLDADQFDAASDVFLTTVRDKLANYKATAGALPTLEQADPSRAAAIAHSPMPWWCERMVTAYLAAEGGSLTHDLFRYDLTWPDGIRQESVTFQPRAAVDSGLQQLTVHDERIRRIVDNGFVFAADRGVPIVRSDGFVPGVSGMWTLWRVEAHTEMENLVAMLPVLVDDEGKALLVSGRHVWEALCSDAVPTVVDTLSREKTGELLASARALAEPLAYQKYQELVQRHQQDLDRENEAREAAFGAQQQLIDRVALDNIRSKRQRDLDRTRTQWRAELDRRGRIAPVLECILAMQITPGDNHAQ